MKLSLRYSGLAVCLLTSPLALGAGASGQAIGFTCAGCHGTDGESQGSAPKDFWSLRRIVVRALPR